MAEEDEEEFDEVKPPSKLPMILGMVAMLIAGGGGGFFAAKAMGGGDSSDDGAADGVEGELAEGEDALEEIPITRAIHNLGRVTVNLRGGGGGRVLRFEVQIEVGSDQLDLIAEKIPPLRDAVVTLASDYTYAELEGLDGKMRLRDELLGRLNATLGEEGEVDRLYFTEFVVQ